MLTVTYVECHIYALMLNVVMLSVVAPPKVLLKGAPLCQTHSLLTNIWLGFKKRPGANALAYFQH